MPQRMIRPGRLGGYNTHEMRAAVADQLPFGPDGPGPGPGLTVAVDAMGSDHAPAESVAGAVAAHRDLCVQVTLAGQPEPLMAELARHEVTASQIPTAPAEDVL